MERWEKCVGRRRGYGEELSSRLNKIDIGSDLRKDVWKQEIDTWVLLVVCAFVTSLYLVTLLT